LLSAILTKLGKTITSLLRKNREAFTCSKSPASGIEGINTNLNKAGSNVDYIVYCSCCHGRGHDDQGWKQPNVGDDAFRQPLQNDNIKSMLNLPLNWNSM
jgi:hypothetical protein